MLLRVSLTASWLAALALASDSACRCFPGDACWPSQDIWAQFNQSVDGQLVKTIPLGTPCHAPHYDAKECTKLRKGWQTPEEHYESSSSVMAPFFANGTCDPYNPVSTPCTLGNYVVYAVNVTKPDHISKAVKFATNHNIRLVVRNTGHDYNGKSTGAGALGVWTHNLKNLKIHDYQDDLYRGKAMTMGAGIQGFEAYEAADRANLQVVGGECPTVGLAGGYSQGGGHSALASRYGLGADQVLEWKVVDGRGKLITARRDNENSDLFWALSGGGTYGVVYEMTSKAHPGTPVSGLHLSFSNANITQDTFYEAISIWHTNLPALVDAGAMSVWFYTNTSFSISPLTGPNIPKAKLVSLLGPFLRGLKKLDIQFTLSGSQYDSYYDEFKGEQGAIGVGEAQYGGWLIPRSVVENNNEGLTKAYREITEEGATFIGVGLNVSREVTGDVYNSVLPAWRETLIASAISTPWKWGSQNFDEMIAWQRKMTDVFIPKLEAVAPHSGAYMNEADFRQPNWQKAFYGRNYRTLRNIKTKYDPSDVFFGKTAVGSDEWAERQDGRLCRVSYWQADWMQFGSQY